MAISNFKVKEISVEKGGELFDFSRGVTKIDYYEDILSPTVVCDLTFVDGDGLAGRIPITGGEFVNLEIESEFPTKQKLSFRVDDKNSLCIMNNSISPSPQNQIYSFRLMSDDVLKNETSRVVKKYSSKISSVVQTILTDKELIGTKRELKIDETPNNYSFIGSFKRPFDIITWLCPKSNSESNSSNKSDGTVSAGYFFFETKDGYNFIGIDNQFKNSSNVIELFQSNTPLKPTDEKFYRSFSDIQMIKNNDVLQSLRHGTYAHTSIFYDVYSMEYDVVKTKLKDKYSSGQLKPSNPDVSSVKLNGLEDYSSRLMFRILDRGSMKDDGEQFDPPEVAKEQANAYMRYNLLFANSIKITLPLNLELSAGQIVELNIAEASANYKKNEDKYDRNLSGKYMISKLRHSMLGDTNFTALELIRDSYGVESE